MYYLTIIWSVNAIFNTYDNNEKIFSNKNNNHNYKNIECNEEKNNVDNNIRMCRCREK